MKELEDLGLSEKEARVYLASLEIGRVSGKIDQTSSNLPISVKRLVQPLRGTASLGKSLIVSS